MPSLPQSWKGFPREKWKILRGRVTNPALRMEFRRITSEQLERIRATAALEVYYCRWWLIFTVRHKQFGIARWVVERLG